MKANFENFKKVLKRHLNAYWKMRTFLDYTSHGTIFQKPFENIVIPKLNEGFKKRVRKICKEFDVKSTKSSFHSDARNIYDFDWKDCPDNLYFILPSFYNLEDYWLKREDQYLKGTGNESMGRNPCVFRFLEGFENSWIYRDMETLLRGRLEVMKKEIEVQSLLNT